MLKLRQGSGERLVSALVLGSGLLLWASVRGSGAEETTATTPGSAAPLQDLITYTEKFRDVIPMRPGDYDGRISMLAASVLENAHYSRHRLDDVMSERFYERFLHALDPQHFHFTQADLKEFEQYEDRLDDYTRRQGNTFPAFEIFARFLRRLDQRTTLVAAMLQEGEPKFDTDEEYLASRKDAPWPAHLEEARKLWRQHARYEYLQEKLGGKKHEEIVETLSNRYKRTLRLLGEFDSDDVIQVYLSALANAYDPHTDYMGQAQLENFAISMKLSLFGIGALLSYDDGYCTIESLVPEGPAERSKKLSPKDRIVGVQQEGEESVDVVGMKLQKVVEMIRGRKGTPVTLTIIPASASDSSERKTVTLIRDEIKLRDQQAKAELIELLDGNGHTNRVGLIDLPSFYASVDLGTDQDEAERRSTSQDVALLLDKLKAEGAEGIILDLRRNGGGSLEEAIRLTGLFIKEGPIVQVRDTTGDISREYDPDPGILYEGPLVVLTSRFSASASEILAAALQDYGRALIVGDKNTHGKGTVQTIFELGRTGSFPPEVNPGAIKVTIRKFYRANGESTQMRGVVPDIILPSVNNLLEVGEANQEYALPWDTIPSADYTPLNEIAPLLTELRRRSELRLATDKDFAYVREDIVEYNRLKADKVVSLNEAVRRQEKEEAEARKTAREEERAGREPLPETRYEITLRLAGQPGLPDPVSDAARPSNANADQEAEPPDLADAGETDKAELQVDAGLKEAKRILLDLIELSHPTSAPASRPMAVTAR